MVAVMKNLGYVDVGLVDLFTIRLYEETPETFAAEGVKLQVSSGQWPFGKMKMYPEELFRNKLTDLQTLIFVSVTTLLLVLSVVGNTATIIVTYWRKHRLLYKGCLVSLAFSDLFLTLVTCTNNLTRFEQTHADWLLGSFMCSFIPLVQTTCVLANSMTLCAISIDRYQSVMRALNSTREPRLWMCVFCLSAIWITSTATSVPMYLSYTQEPMKLFESNASNTITGVIDLKVCVMKEKQFEYLLCVFSVIFLPLLLTFIALHGIIAVHIWRRRAPFARHNDPTASDMTVSSPQVAHSRVNKKAVEAPRFIFKNQSQTAWSPSNDDATGGDAAKAKRTVHMERKLRTFKVIIVIMVTFFVCRLPSWIVLLMKASPKGVTGDNSWLLQYSFSTLSLANSAINPFLYGLLNETLAAWRDISAWLERNPCTCCFGKDGAKKCFNVYPMCHCSDGERDGGCKEGGKLKMQLPATTTLMVPRSPFSLRERMDIKEAVDKDKLAVEDNGGGVYPTKY